MILGMSTATYTLVHVLISLLGIGSGFIVLFGMLGGKRLNGWTALFLITTVATSVTRIRISRDPYSPVAHYRDALIGGAGDCDRGSLRKTPRRRLAENLCDQRLHCPLLQSCLFWWRSLSGRCRH